MHASRWWMLGVTCLSVVVISLDLTVLNIALPDISAALRAGTGDLQRVVDAYALVFAGVMLPAGMVGDRFGRKRMLLAGLAIFLVASLWCAVSGSVGELIAARALLGLGAGIVFPLSVAVVSVAFDEDDRPKAIGWFTASVALGLPLGPVLGGLLLQYFSWHWVFLINLPAAGLTLAAGAVLMTESRNPAAPPLKAPGTLLPAAAVVCLVWGVINGPEQGWTAPSTWLLLAGAAASLAAFLRHERRTAHPVIDPALLRDPRFTWGTAATVAVSVALFGLLFVIPQYLQSVLGEDPITAGLRLLPLMGGLLIAGAAAGLLARAVGTGPAVAAGLAVLTVGLAVLSQIHPATGYGLVATGLALCGLGTGVSIAAAMDAVMAAAGGDEAGIGASVNSALRQVGGAIAIAVLGSTLSAAYTHSLSPALTALPGPDASAARASINQAVQIAAHLPTGGPALRTAAGTAFLHGMGIVMLACAALTALATVTSLRYLPGRTDTGPDAGSDTGSDTASPQQAPTVGTG